jgi:diguanylate cyclase (GGDEF)-like protein
VAGRRPLHRPVPGVLAQATTAGDELAVEATRDRIQARPDRRERWTSLAATASALAAAAGLAAVGLSHGTPSWWTLAAYVAAYAVALSVQFEIAFGSAVPTELVLVPMLFALDPYLVPAAVVAGLVAGALVDLARGRVHAERILVVPASAWHAVGPALVIGLLAPGQPHAGRAGVYVLALGAQFAFDFGSTATRHALALGAGPRALVRPMLSVFVADSALAPVALLAALGSPARPLLLVPLGVLLAWLAHDRRERIDRSIELGRAYAGAWEKARRDPLTGVGNRLAWEEALSEASAALEGGARHAVLLVDVDHLKAANDEHGHAFGDRLLRATAGAVTGAVRGEDVVARIGGDEFAIIAPGLDADGAQELASRVRSALATQERLDGLSLAASVGSAAVPPASSFDEALLAADAALYAQKTHSRTHA